MRRARRSRQWALISSATSPPELVQPPIKLRFESVTPECPRVLREPGSRSRRATGRRRRPQEAWAAASQLRAMTSIASIKLVPRSGERQVQGRHGEPQTIASAFEPAHLIVQMAEPLGREVEVRHTTIKPIGQVIDIPDPVNHTRRPIRCRDDQRRIRRHENRRSDHRRQGTRGRRTDLHGTESRSSRLHWLYSGLCLVDSVMASRFWVNSNPAGGLSSSAGGIHGGSVIISHADIAWRYPSYR